MKTALSIIIVVFAIPLIAFVTFYVAGGKVILVHTDGTASFEVTARTGDGAVIEDSDKRVVDTGKLDWMIIFPKTKGAMRLRCIDNSGLATIQLGPDAPTRFLYANVTLAGCHNLERRSGFSL
jgi:hypothetical protein